MKYGVNFRGRPAAVKIHKFWKGDPLEAMELKSQKSITRLGSIQSVHEQSL